jgi:hypothetical protein
MSILGPHGLSLHSPFCDALNVTTPFENSDELQASCGPILSQLGATDSGRGHWEVPILRSDGAGSCAVDLDETKRKPGSVVFKRWGQVLQVGTSGGALRSMRVAGLFDHWLSILSSYPHRVTRLDAAVDVFVPAAPRVLEAYRYVRVHGLALGRKRTPSARCSSILRTAHYGDGEAVETGSVYVGRYGTSEICARIYDKRNEVLDRGGSDPGDWMRVELTFSGQVGCTLRDASQPGPLFWNYAAELLQPPGGFREWSKGDTGFDLNKPPPLDPVVAITRACERNDGLRTVIRFSDKLGIARKHLWGYMNHAHPVGVLS